VKLSLKYFINKNIVNLLVIYIVIILSLFYYLKQIQPTIVNFFFAPHKLDYQIAFTQENLLTLMDRSKEEQPKKDIASILKNKLGNLSQFDVEAQSMFDYNSVYVQNHKYKFKIRSVNEFDLGLAYETNYTLFIDRIKTQPIKPLVTHKYILIDVGNVLLLTKVSPDFKIKPTQMHIGVFLPIKQIVVEDLQKILGQRYKLDNLFIYEFDTLTNFSSYELQDILFLIILLIIVLFLGIKILSYIINYKNHPTYKQLYKFYGAPSENEININLELNDMENINIVKNTYITNQFKIKKGLFKTKISEFVEKIR
jgi:hypothetical protein